MITTLGYFFLFGILVPLLCLVVYIIGKEIWRHIKCYRNNVCPKCNGNKGWDSLLLIFSRYSWIRCDRCKGSGKWKADE